MYFNTLISGKILKKLWHVQFLDKSRISVWKGLSLVALLISNTGRWWNLFSLKWVLFLMYFYTLISGKIIKTFWQAQFLHTMENLCLERLGLIVLLMNSTDWWWNIFSLKWVLLPMYFYMLISSKIFKKFWQVQFLHNMENLRMEGVKPGRFIHK